MKKTVPVRTDFDRAFFARFYHAPATAVTSGDDVLVRARFVLAYMAYLSIPVRTVLDAGCGTGLWKRALLRIDRSIEYTGIDPSEYLSRRYGWIRGSIADFRPRRRHDLVVCQDVMQYMDAGEVDRGLAAIARACRGALYFDVPTRDDIDAGLYDMRRTDRRIHVRSAAWYRRRLSRHFESAGGGLYVSPRAHATLLSLERGR
jgi:SAM-dependent methyltransferase